MDLSDEQIKHEITMHVEAPIRFCYNVWADRLNYTEWFDLIAEVRDLHISSLSSPLSKDQL